jgi:hypothetical protein
LIFQPSLSYFPGKDTNLKQAGLYTANVEENEEEWDQTPSESCAVHSHGDEISAQIVHYGVNDRMNTMDGYDYIKVGPDLSR